MIRNRRSELTDPIPARRCTNTHVVAGVSAQQAGEGHADCHDCQNHQKFVINCIFLSYWQYHLELFSKFKFFKKIFCSSFYESAETIWDGYLSHLSKAHIIQRYILIIDSIYRVKHVKIIIFLTNGLT